MHWPGARNTNMSKRESLHFRDPWANGRNRRIHAYIVTQCANFEITFGLGFRTSVGVALLEGISYTKM